jgi:hypothetical protein
VLLLLLVLLLLGLLLLVMLLLGLVLLLVLVVLLVLVLLLLVLLVVVLFVVVLLRARCVITDHLGDRRKSPVWSTEAIYLLRSTAGVPEGRSFSLSLSLSRLLLYALRHTKGPKGTAIKKPTLWNRIRKCRSADWK